MLTLNEKKLYDKAKSLIGTSLSPNDPTYGCATSVNQIHRLTFGDEIGGGASTWLLWQALKSRADFEQIPNYEQGAIIISPSGTSTISGKYNGHVGIVGKNPSPDGTVYIMSNNSVTGRVDTQLTIKKWRVYYEGKGFPIYYFRKLDVEAVKKKLLQQVLNLYLIIIKLLSK